jgi:hypothetical protein
MEKLRRAAEETALHNHLMWNPRVMYRTLPHVMRYKWPCTTRR